MDDPSACPYLYADGLSDFRPYPPPGGKELRKRISDELLFFAQARPHRRMIRL